MFTENGREHTKLAVTVFGWWDSGWSIFPPLCFLIFSKLFTVSVNDFHDQKKIQCFLKSIPISLHCSLSLTHPWANTHFHGLFELLHNLVLDGGITDDIVGGHAGLARVHEFPPGDASVKIPD